MSRKLIAAALAAALTAGTLAVLLVGSGSAAPQATFKAALVSDVGKFNDKSFNQSQLEGLKRAQKKLKISILPIQSNSTSEYVPNFVRAVQQKSNIVIGAGFLLADALKQVADQFPNQKFAITDYDATTLPFNGTTKDGKQVTTRNVQGITFATNENSYLIGCMAAMVTKMQKRPHIIGYVGGLKIPTVTIFLAGYQAGARKCVPGTKVLSGYSQDFVKQDLCKNVALDQLQQGAQAIFGVAGQCGLGALAAARDAGKWGIGVDKDQSFLGKYILTSAVKRVDIGVFNTVQKAKSGTFRGGRNLTFNLKNNGVTLGKISPRLNKTIKKKVLAKLAVLKKQIIKGKIKPPRTVG